MVANSPPDLSLTEWVVLGLLAEGPAHGFALARQLRPDTPVGRVWAVPRPLVYRALTRLEHAGLVRPLGEEASPDGPPRSVYRLERRGRSALYRWLDTPVDHLRQVRTELLTKLVLGERLGRDPTRLVEAQESIFTPLIDALDDPVEAGADVVARWRSEIARATARFLHGLRAGVCSTAVGVMVAVALLAAACGTSKETSTPPAPTVQPSKLQGDITVLAAASLTGAFTDIGKAFEADNSGTKVTFSFDASSTLATQANSGAPADVFASADEANLQKVIDAGNASEAAVFARNHLAILVGKGNPKGIRGLKDLARSGVSFVLCAAPVPCGKYGAQVLQKAGVTAQPKSFEANVKGVVAKVQTGEVDAGIVYVTDVKAGGDKVKGVDIPEADNVIASYPLAVLKQSGRPNVAQAFKGYVLSSIGQQILASYGFLPAT